MTLRKTYEIESFKALPDKDGITNRFEAIVSVFGNVDVQGDRVVKGAFAKSIGEWRAKGDPIPVIWSHMWGDPFAHIGWADPKDVVETDQGLKVIGFVDDDNPFAVQVYRLMKGRRVKEFSFAYDVRKERRSKDDGANELLDLSIIEVGPALKGANPDTELLGVKAKLEAAAVASAHTGKNVYAAVPGSLEERQTIIQAAVTAWRDEKFVDGSNTWVSVAATFDDHVIIAVEPGAEKDVDYFRATYTMGSDGIKLGDPEPVDLDITTVPAADDDDDAKADDRPLDKLPDDTDPELDELRDRIAALDDVDDTGAKAGRALSKANESKLKSAADAIVAAADAINGVLETVAAADVPADTDAKADVPDEDDPAMDVTADGTKAADPDDIMARITAIEAL